MKMQSFVAMVVSSAVMVSSSVYADHNSPMGAGTANMPNDIHNTRIEDDNATFLDLVQGGGGADSINRYSDDSTDTLIRSTGSRSRMSSSRMSSRSGGMGRGGRR
jgi:hypothetical protein